ncbi:GIN domain-containing protein, partial [Burkholderia sp. AU4i]|uniref:GIN domain-containing protein n=1 Tax=Burkholderia sp. AU4i TaxID=1335308 RepID=UPI0005B489A4
AGETADAVASVKTTYKDDKLVVEREGVTIAVGGSVMVFRGSVGSIVMGNGNIVSGLPNGSAVSLRQERVVVGVVLPALPAVKLKGSGVVTLHDLRQPRLELEVTGSGDIIATGQVGSLDARVAGSGDVEARKLAAERADLSVSGSGDIVARVQVEVRARVAGSGDIVVHG